MKALLINPFSVFYTSKHADLTPKEPLSLEYLTTMTRDHDVEIFDCVGGFPGKFSFLSNDRIHVGASLKQIHAKIVDYKPDLVGITSPFDTQITSVYSIFDLVKKINSEIITVIGGCTASCYPEDTLNENHNIDMAVVGEGEITFKEILDTGASDPSLIDGVVYRNNKGAIVRNKPRKLIKNLDEIPFPRRDLVPFENYLVPIDKWAKVRFSLKTRGVRHIIRKMIHSRTNMQTRAKGRMAKLLTSRGCPYNCYFCAAKNVWGRSYRMRTANNVLEEMQLLYDNYNIRHFGIVDDNFNVSRKRTIEICKGIVERGLDVSMRSDSGTYLSSIDEEVLTWMKKAGFGELYFAVESGNKEVVQKVIGKNVNLQQVRDVARMCKKLGITSGGFFIVGIPGETVATMEDTVKFAMDSSLDRVRLYTCQPYRGSKLYDDAKKNGWITEDYDSSKPLIFESKGYLKTKDFTPEDVCFVAEQGKKILSQQNRLDS